MYHGPLTPDYCGSVVAMYGLYDGVFMYIEPSGNGAGVGSDSLCHLNCVCHHAASLLVSCVTIHPHQAICMKMDEWYLTCATQAS